MNINSQKKYILIGNSIPDEENAANSDQICNRTKKKYIWYTNSFYKIYENFTKKY